MITSNAFMLTRDAIMMMIVTHRVLDHVVTVMGTHASRTISMGDPSLREIDEETTMTASILVALLYVSIAVGAIPWALQKLLGKVKRLF